MIRPYKGLISASAALWNLFCKLRLPVIKTRSMGAERQILLFSLLAAIYQKTDRDIKGARLAGRSFYP